MNLEITKSLDPSGNYYRILAPENTKAKATVLILHGMKEHSGRYIDFANYLVKQGFAVLLYDHIGHGKTSEKNELGFFKNEHSAEQLVADAKHMARILASNFPGIPHFVFGHSMGSFITRNLLQEESSSFKGAIIMGTGGRIFGISLARSFFKLLNFVAPQYKSKFVNSLFDSINNKRFKNEQPADGTNWLSISLENRQNFIQDPLCGVDFSYNGFFTLFSLVDNATQKSWGTSIEKSFPMLFLSGKDDPIGDFSKGVLQTTNHLKELGFDAVSVKIYEKLRHEILNESSKEEVYKDISAWLSVQTKQ